MHLLLLMRFRSLADTRARHIIQNAALLLPFARAVQERRSTSTGANNRPEVMLEWAERVTVSAAQAGVSIESARIVEVGPGHSLGVGFSLLLAGASEITALDVKRFADAQNAAAFDRIAALWRITHPDCSEVHTRKLLDRLCYAIIAEDGAWPIDSASADIVYSYFAGEHLRDPGAVLLETYRVLRPGGLCMYAIDLRDHLNFEGNWLQHLYHTPRMWERMTSRRGQWSNRIVAPQWRELFEKDFDIIDFEERRQPPHPTFDRTKLSEPYRKYDTDTLSTAFLWVVGRRR